ncbi:MAG: histidine phosphatase family protein [Nanoarchaeota archaeon]|nr:histidine phosphatase family protein [Nanoarchaeota archaeon]
MAQKKYCYIYLFRHGLTYYNQHHWFTGQLDSKLTKKGIENAKYIAQQLKNKSINFAYRTSLSRSKGTLREILKFHPECTDIIEDDRILERNYGKLQKRNSKGFMFEIGNVIVQALEDKYGKMKNKHKKELEKNVSEFVYNIYHRSYDIPPPGGETLKEVETRVNLFIKDLINKAKKEKINIAICAHNNSIRFLRKYFEKLSSEETMRLETGWGNYFEFKIKI